MVTTAAPIPLTKPELRFCAGSNPAYDVSEVCDNAISDSGPGWK